MFNLANAELCKISDWLNANKSSVNYDKTNYIIFQPDKYKENLINDNNYSIIFNNHVIQRIFCTKYLGVFIDDKLSWKEHIKFLTNKINSVIGVLYRNCSLLPISCKRCSFFALVHSHLTHCIEVYANTTKSNLNSLIIKCNSLLRVIQCKPRRTHIFDLYSNFNTLLVDLLFQMHILKLIHRCLYSRFKVPGVICNLFRAGSQLHCHGTRSQKNFIRQNNLDSKSISFYGPNLWNKLPLSLQSYATGHTFVKHLKLYLLGSI